MGVLLSKCTQTSLPIIMLPKFPQCFVACFSFIYMEFFFIHCNLLSTIENLPQFTKFVLRSKSYFIKVSFLLTSDMKTLKIVFIKKKVKTTFFMHQEKYKMTLT